LPKQKANKQNCHEEQWLRQKENAKAARDAEAEANRAKET